jgi:hypothetical protein
MRTRKLHWPDQALPTLETFLTPTKEPRIFRRAPAVREVVTGRRLHTVAASLHLTDAALRQWVHRFANQGGQGWGERPRPGRPSQGPCALAHHLARLVDHDPLQHGSSHSPWSGQELAPGRARPGSRSAARASGQGAKTRGRSSRPTGRLAPDPAALAWASLDLAALESQARRGESRWL